MEKNAGNRGFNGASSNRGNIGRLMNRNRNVSAPAKPAPPKQKDRAASEK